MLLMEEAVSRSDKAETGRMQEKRGYSVFGKEYEQMLRHDLHAENSIDHQLLRRICLLYTSGSDVADSAGASSKHIL